MSPVDFSKRPLSAVANYPFHGPMNGVINAFSINRRIDADTLASPDSWPAREFMWSSVRVYYQKKHLPHRVHSDICHLRGDRRIGDVTMLPNKWQSSLYCMPQYVVSACKLGFVCAFLFAAALLLNVWQIFLFAFSFSFTCHLTAACSVQEYDAKTRAAMNFKHEDPWSEGSVYRLAKVRPE